MTSAVSELVFSSESVTENIAYMFQHLHKHELGFALQSYDHPRNPNNIHRVGYAPNASPLN